MGPDWKKDLRYQNESLVTDVFLKNEALGLELRCSDGVDLDLNIYIKKIEVTNLKDKARQARLFFSHDFYLYGNDIGGTAYFDPRSRSITRENSGSSRACGFNSGPISNRECPWPLLHREIR